MTQKQINGKTFKAYKATETKARAMEIKKSLMAEGYTVAVRKGRPLEFARGRFTVWMRR